MKKLWIVIFILLLVFSFAMAQPVYWAEQQTIYWDEVTTWVDDADNDGQPDLIPSEFLPVVYDIWLADSDGDIRINGTEVKVAENVAGLSYVVTIPDGLSDVGAQAVIWYGSYAAVSIISWLSEEEGSEWKWLGKARNPAAPGIRLIP